ncbi:interleukin-1 beta [Hemiscyllium ocellatum]|uniref:interleukin-1 beta n=1 Tax=Hemiscyllium ocellatum TaxID=170820 RepID=UPI002966E681|nr:interleukin-1 beta [Hemiscyllium ocellatum]
MRTELRSVSVPARQDEAQRPFSYKCRKDSAGSQSTCVPLQSPLQVKIPNKMEECGGPDGGEEHESYQLKITGASSAIVPMGSTHLSLERSVMLVLAMERLKAGLQRHPSPEGWAHDSSAFADSDLLENFAAIMEEIDPCLISDGVTESSSCRFRFVHTECRRLTDDRDRALILAQDMQLLAVSLRSPVDAVQLDVMYYKSTGDQPEMLPVVLGVSHQNLFITCTGPQERPRVRIEKWDENLRNISSATDLLRFVFFKRVGSGGHYFELESAMYRGWYISTALSDGQPIEMGVKTNRKRVTIFTAE